MFAPFDWILILFLLFANLTGFLLMIADKRRAKRKIRRIPEKTLFLAAALGGGPGVFLAMKVARHKTKHASFRFGIPILTLLSYGLLAWLRFR